MKIDIDLESTPRTAAERARSAERVGYHGAFFSEIRSDPFQAVASAAAATEKMDVGTAVAIALARNPMSLAISARDAQVYCRGRFILGIGSQIRPHITRRYSMPWSRPVARMREYVAALRRIWNAFESGERLNFNGEYYNHTLMGPEFNPGPTGFGTPPLLLGAVGRRMTAVAAEAADGLILHPLTTRRYLSEVTLPTVKAARRTRNSSCEDFTLRGMSYVATGSTEEGLATATAEIRRLVAFHASTPAYRAVLEVHGWGALQDELHTLAKQGRWADMTGLIDDEILDAVAIVGEPLAVADELVRRFGDVLTRLSILAPYEVHADFWAPVVERIRNGSGDQCVW